MLEGLFQLTHLILVLAVALLVFGPRKLPELGQGLGKGIRGFKDALRGISEHSEHPVAEQKWNSLSRQLSFSLVDATKSRSLGVMEQRVTGRSKF